MQAPTMIEASAIGWLLFLSVFGLALCGLAALVLRAWDHFAGPESMPAIERRPRPERYPGCMTCEAAEAASVHSLMRHQTRDHVGGIRW